jgi:hypothetical protein
MNYSMTWADFYLICFAVGFCLSFFSFIMGGARTGRLHLPHFHGHVGGAHIPSPTVPVAHAPVSGHTPAGGSAGTSQAVHQGSGVSPFNFVTLTAFLAWYRIFADALLRSVGRLRIAGFSYQRTGGRGNRVRVSEPRVDLGRREYGFCRLRDGRSAGSNLQCDPRWRYGRNDLYADGNAACVWRAQRGW